MGKKEIIWGLGLALVVALFSWLASSFPDGLQKVAREKNFILRAYSVFRVPFAGYSLPGVSNEKLSTALAAILGVLIVFTLTVFLAKKLKRKK